MSLVVGRCRRHDGCLAGPLVGRALWSGVTLKGAYAGLLGGFGVFIVLHSQVLEPSWFSAVVSSGNMAAREGPTHSCA